MEAFESKGLTDQGERETALKTAQGGRRIKKTGLAPSYKTREDEQDESAEEKKTALQPMLESAT